MQDIRDLVRNEPGVTVGNSPNRAGFQNFVIRGIGGNRVLLMVDGMPACAALMLAARIAQPVTDYSLFCRSHSHLGLDQALNLFRASALLELGMESTDGTGATLAWPMVKSAAALLTDVAEGEDPGPSQPDSFWPVPEGVPAELPPRK
jgi:nicotinate-nucleotide--dimethylbenzimidazole phosphoribosyltransferase